MHCNVDYSPDGFKALKDVTGFEHYCDYYIHVRGDVWSTKTGRLQKLKPGARKKEGYLFVVLTDKHGKKKSWSVHHLVASTFIRPRRNTEEINHIDRNAFNNCVDNLEWCTREENMTHCYNTLGATLDQTVITKAKQLHAKLQSQGQQLPALHCFINALLEGEIDRLSAHY